ncbi:MAG: hypothetical protein R2880_12485 [Deinococcales bacterium]
MLKTEVATQSHDGHVLEFRPQGKAQFHAEVIYLLAFYQDQYILKVSQAGQSYSWSLPQQRSLSEESWQESALSLSAALGLELESLNFVGTVQFANTTSELAGQDPSQTLALFSAELKALPALDGLNLIAKPLSELRVRERLLLELYQSQAHPSSEKGS